MRFNTITFFGLGLIGGSIAKAIHDNYPNIKIKAHARHADTIKAAYQDGVIINESLLDMKELADSDLIFLCGPVGINITYMKELSSFIKSDTILTDVGSVKGDIHKAADELGLSDKFVGGHPMTGSEKTGYENSSVHLLENAYYILTAENKEAASKMPELEALIKTLGCVTLTLSPETHDFATGAISHLPHVVSAALVNLVSDNETDDCLLKTIAAGGFRDITRISSSSPEMWEHIMNANRDQVLRLIDLYKKSLDDFKSSIEAKDMAKVNSLFTSAKDYRDSLSVRKKGGILPTYIFYCDLFDEAGQIAAVATILASNGISIKNIGIIHNREYQEGVLLVELYDMDSMENAVTLLEKHHYTIHRRK
ncbi:MAG: prephenate dehydrogenase [Lachnospiraceae bacterium]|nr:prephenate dehydrogenase [Lachnospiraceae bacterium]